MKIALFIDDNASVRESISDLVVRTLGLMVLVYPTWNEAVKATGHSDEVVLVVSDFDFGMLDSRTGYEVLSLAVTQWPGARTILCSGLDRPVVPGIVDRFISKSNLGELIDEFKAALK